MSSYQMPIAQRARDVYDLLKAGKKVTVASDHKLKHYEDWNNPTGGEWNSNKTRHTPILYFWANPQMNRMMGKLADGRTKDINLNLLDLQYYTFIEYIEDEKPPSGWRDIFDARKIFPADYTKSRNTAKQMGYPYVCFNGRIFSVKDEYMAFPICAEEEI